MKTVKILIATIAIVLIGVASYAQQEKHIRIWHNSSVIGEYNITEIDSIVPYTVNTGVMLVEAVKVSPATATVQVGNTQQFTASVTAVGGASQAVDWSIIGNITAGTKISSSGVLTVAAGETAGTVTIKATSQFNSSKFGTASVTITPVSVNQEVTSVEVSPATATVQVGNTQQFTASVAAVGGASQAVDWSIIGNIAAGTSISTNGLLTVAADETAETLTIKATSTFDKTKFGTASVSIVSAFGSHTETAGSATFNMIAVTGSAFTMQGESVTLSNFYIGETEVTQQLWDEVMGKPLTEIISDNRWGSYGVGNNYPMYYVNWYDAITFCNKLSILKGKEPVYTVSGVNFNTITYSGIPTFNNTTWNAATMDYSKNGYRLATEAEWQYAAMGGVSQDGATTYSGNNSIDGVAWYWSNIPTQTSGRPGYGTQPVATKQANSLGIYDMSGNVWEWSNDLWQSSFVGGTNPTGAVSNSDRVGRGGGWDVNATNCQVAYRGFNSPYYRYYSIGFRFVCSAE